MNEFSSWFTLSLSLSQLSSFIIIFLHIHWYLDTYKRYEKKTTKEFILYIQRIGSLLPKLKKKRKEKKRQKTYCERNLSEKKHATTTDQRKIIVAAAIGEWAPTEFSQWKARWKQKKIIIEYKQCACNDQINAREPFENSDELNKRSQQQNRHTDKQ